MRILLFGTGDYYHKYKGWFAKEDIVGILDNNREKQGMTVDGVQVYAPKEGILLPHDRICILSVHREVIRGQLIDLGVPDKNIIHYSELYKYPELIRIEQQARFWNSNGEEISCAGNEFTDILLMSHDLNFNGAALALYYAACVLVRNGYRIWFAAWADGAMKKLLQDQGIGVIVDPNLQIETAQKIKWISKFHYVICNTLLYSTMLSERDRDTKFIWWLHEPRLFYQSINQCLARKTECHNLKAYAVGPVALHAFQSVFSHMEVQELLYGIPDVAWNHGCNKDHIKLELITIGNIQEYKGQDILVDAIRLLPETYKRQIHIRIIGGSDSAFSTAVKHSAAAFSDIVDFIPPLGREEIYRCYRDADVYICPSREDCMPVVVAESMMFSLPCIVSDSTGIAPYIKESGGGLLFSCGNSRELSEKICWCVDHRAELGEMGKRSRKEYETSFSMDRLEENILAMVHNFFDI